MKALLVNPFWGGSTAKKGPVYARRFPPVELAGIAALLREDGHEPRILDANVEHLGPAELAARAGDFDIVYVSSSNLDKWCCPEIDIEPFEEAVRALRRVVPRCVILGAHPTAWPEALLRRTGAWAAVVGEPEQSARELASASNPGLVPGVAALDAEGRLQQGPARDPLDLNDLPTPAFDLLPRGAYRYEVLGSDLMVFELSRGCPYTCSYCNKGLYGHGHRSRSPERFVLDIERAISTLGVRTAYFMDLEYTLERDRAMEVNGRLRALANPLEWCCQTRVDLVDPLLLRDMKSAGCSLIHFGVESGSQGVLDTIGKRTTLEQAERAVALARESGLRVACFFMMGFPGETRADLLSTLRFARRLDPDFASFHLAVPYPHTELYRQLPEPASELFPRSFPAGRSQAEMEAWLRAGFLSFYLRPGYLWRQARALRWSDGRRLAPILWWYLR